MVSRLNERSVVMGTLSSPTASPFTVSENQLSAHTSAVKLTASEPAVVVSGVVDEVAPVVEVVTPDAPPGSGPSDPDDEQPTVASESRASSARATTGREVMGGDGRTGS